MRRAGFPFLALLISVLSLVPAAPGVAQPLDKGSFVIRRGDRTLGVETFEMIVTGDSLMVLARQRLLVPTAAGEESLQKGADFYVDKNDFSMRLYQSNRKFRGEELIRGLVVADTHFVAYREEGHGGKGDSFRLPPGRLYVMDSQIVTLFDLICRSLRDKTFDQRPLNLLALGPRDTLLEAQVVSLGEETLRWGGKPVVTRKLHIVADDATTFTAWAGTRGEMLRLTEPVSGLRVDREAPPLRRPAATRPPKPGG
jgi:hypothetical protein